MKNFLRKICSNLFLNKSKHKPIKQAGFTLVELIIVIAIIGVLASFALPRFPDIARKARVASVENLAKALEEAVEVTSVMSLEQDGVSPITFLDAAGTQVTMAYGAPTAATGGIDNALKGYKGFTYDGTSLFSMNSAPSAATCSVTYDTTGLPTSIKPTITPDITGC